MDRDIIWVPRDDCETNQNMIRGFLATTAMLPDVRESLLSVMLEMDVTRGRDALFPEGVENARLAGAVQGDVLPILMTESEVEALRSVPHLPQSTLAALPKGKRDDAPVDTRTPRGVRRIEPRH